MTHIFDCEALVHNCYQNCVTSLGAYILKERRLFSMFRNIHACILLHLSTRVIVLPAFSCSFLAQCLKIGKSAMWGGVGGRPRIESHTWAPSI